MKLKNRMKKNIVLMLLLALVLGVGYASMEKTVYAAEEDETPADNEDGGYTDDPAYYQDLSTPTPTPSATPYTWVVEVTPKPLGADKYYTDEDTGYTYDHSGFYIKDGTLISFYDYSLVNYQGYMFIDPVDEDGVLHLPDGITRIAANAFEESGARVKKIIIPETVTKIDDAALFLSLIIEFENSNCNITSKAFMDIEGESAAIYATIIAQKNSNVWKAAVETGCVVSEDATVKPVKSKMTFMTYGTEVGQIRMQNVSEDTCIYRVSDNTAIHVDEYGTISTGGKPGTYQIYVTVPKENKTFTIQVEVQKRTVKSVVKYIKNYVFTKGMTTMQKKDKVLHWLSHYMYYDGAYQNDTVWVEGRGYVKQKTEGAVLSKKAFTIRHNLYQNSQNGMYALKRGLGICTGLARGAQYLLEQTVKGLKVKYAISGDGEHSYIRIKEGKKWVNEDVSGSAIRLIDVKWIYSMPGYNEKIGKDALTYASVFGMTPEEYMQQDSSDDDA